MKRFRYGGEGDAGIVNIANVLMLLSRHGHDQDQDRSTADDNRVFECKTCNRQFSSFQALGGHRASHKKPRLTGDNQSHSQSQSAADKPKVHECSICGLEFAIGQALGGHMRRHRVSNEGFVENKFDEKRSVRMLDLNFPPSDDNLDCRKLELGLGLGLRHADKTPMVGFL